eukprot:GEMP01040603.1.p1 GENE.GEMP01040603.1~~GEMP01040603.1.p1  ORF type:complete len:246 (-),score=53.52 GEMP01040603.1:1069-1806(-)
MAPLEFCSAWFCPYAQRAWIALNHHRIPYTLIESLEVVPGGYRKAPLLLEKNPNGLVPTIIDDKKRTIYESLLCVEYVDELAKDSDTAPSLLPGDAMERANLRLKANWANKHLCSPFYKVLMPTGTREESFKLLMEDIRTFAKEIVGPYYLGEQLSIVDIAAFPWAMRMFILEEFFGEQYRLSPSDPTLIPFLQWKNSVAALDAVKTTIGKNEDYVTVYERYRDNCAGSKVADAVMAGKQAHDIE